MESPVTFNGNEISNIPVINRPSYFLVNNYGRETYMTILEPNEEFKKTPERAVLAGAYKSAKQLISAFKEVAPTCAADSRFSRKDTVEVFFMGFRWTWRPNHKSYYGNMREGYEYLPLIARWAVLTNMMESIDNSSLDYLPIKYNGGTAKGFGGMDSVPPTDDTSKMAIDKHLDEIEKNVYGSAMKPIVHSLFGTFMRAAQLNIIPKVAYQIYDHLIQSEWPKNLKQINVKSGCKYVIKCNDDGGNVKYVGALFGGAKIPAWAEKILEKTDGNIIVTLVYINAANINEAENFMKELAGEPLHS